MILESVSPAGLRARADLRRAYDDESGARHLDLAADEIERLQDVLQQIVKLADGASASSWMRLPDVWQRVNDMRFRARSALATLTPKFSCPKCGSDQVYGKEGQRCCLACGAHQRPPTR